MDTHLLVWLANFMALIIIGQVASTAGVINSLILMCVGLAFFFAYANREFKKVNLEVANNIAVMKEKHGQDTEKMRMTFEEDGQIRNHILDKMNLEQQGMRDVADSEFKKLELVTDFKLTYLEGARQKQLEAKQGTLEIITHQTDSNLKIEKYMHECGTERREHESLMADKDQNRHRERHQLALTATRELHDQRLEAIKHDCERSEQIHNQRISSQRLAIEADHKRAEAVRTQHKLEQENALKRYHQTHDHELKLRKLELTAGNSRFEAGLEARNKAYQAALDASHKRLQLGIESARVKTTSENSHSSPFHSYNKSESREAVDAASLASILSVCGGDQPQFALKN